MPFNELHDLPEFKSWLVTTLEPLCDADPEVMSDYIIALLKHDAAMSEEEWKIFIARELADFLEDHSKSFVNLLFQTLHCKSFLPQAPAINPAIQATSAAPPAAAASAPAQAPSGPAAMREAAPASAPSQPSQTRQGGSSQPPASAPRGPSVVSSYRPGVQSSGPSQAPGSVAGPSNLAHGQNGPHPNGQNGQNSQNGQASGDVDMGEQQASGPPGQRQKCFDYHERGFCMFGVACPYEHDSDMIIPSPDMMFSGMARGGGRGGPGGGRGRGRGGGHHGQPGHHGQFPPGPGGPGFDPSAQFMPPFPMGMPGMAGMPFMPFLFAQPFPAANDPRSEYWGTNRPPTDRTTTTIVVTDIPMSHMNIQSVREHFAQFGNITNVAVEAKSRRALVSFETNREAYGAWRSDEAIFGSRHVKVLWHRPRPGQGGAGQKALEASAGLLANMNKLDNGEDAQGAVKAAHSGPENLLQKTLADLEAKERRSKKETLMAEQKVLLKRSEGATKEEKMTILTRVKSINKEIDELDKPIQPTQLLGDKEKLDRELEKLGMETTAGKDKEELMRLSAQLAALKEKASTLGIPETRYSPYGRGSPRGQARGRGRGRGGSAFPPRLMRLDNRSRTIIVTGEAFSSDEGKTSLREWYESTGGNVAAEAGGMTVTYPNREMAEKALSMGTKDIPHTGGRVQATWQIVQPDHGGGAGDYPSQDVEMMEDQRRGDMDEED